MEKAGLTKYWPVIDGHADTLVQSMNEERSFFQRSARGSLDLFRLVEAGVDLQILAICTEQRGQAYTFAVNILEKWAQEYTYFQENSALGSSFIWIKDRTDFEDWEKHKKIGVILGLEGAEPLEGKVERVEEFYQRGVRVLSPTWNYGNELACGVLCKTDTGFTSLGKEIVAEAEKLGYLLDLSHLGYKSFFDLISFIKHTVIVSHANLFELCPHRRNLKTEQIQAIADTGGTVGLTFYPPFIGGGEAGTKDLVPHVQRLLAGWGHKVPAIGGDFDGMDCTPGDLQSVLQLKNLVATFEANGIEREACGRILGRNLYQVLKEVFNRM